MVINYDSTKVISVQKQGEQESIIQMHDLKTKEVTFTETIRGHFIKVKEIA